jgi:hypothetical protein
MWSQEPARCPGESPRFEQDFWDKLHHLRGLDPDQAERYDWVTWAWDTRGESGLVPLPFFDNKKTIVP